MESLIATLAHWFAPWQQLYSDSKVVDTIVMSIHTVAVLLGGGFAVAADRDMLRAPRNDALARRHALDELHATHRPVLIAICVLLVSGIAQAAADINTFAHSPAFGVKLGLVALLLINGVLLYRTETELLREFSEPGWDRLRLRSRVSLVLWTCTVIAGITLINAA